MISRKEKLLWVCYGAVLVLLYLLSSTDLIIKERETEVYPVSVIINDTSDENYVNFRKGVDRAAIELNADVSFISLYEENHRQQQLEMMLREQQDGAKALVVTPVEEQAVEEVLVEKRVTVPLVLVNSELPLDKVSAVVTTDYYEMGQKLAEQVRARYTPDIPVYLFCGPQENTVTRSFGDGIRATLSDAGFEMTLFRRQGEETFRKAVEELVYPGSQNVIVIALDQSSLSETAVILADSSVYSTYVKGLYGRGTTIPILNYLDRGVITGICVTDDFSAGYLSVKRAVEAITNQIVGERILLDSYYIEKADLREEKYEKMLYPIE